MEGSHIRELRVTLFHVMKSIPPYLREEARKDQAMFKRLREAQDGNVRAANAILEKARLRLIDHGLSPERVETKALPRTSDAARDVLFEAEKGLYDAVVMSRRGLTKTQEIFLGSVTNQVVQHAERTPVWVVGGRVTSTKILAAVDGSDGALRAVDHMAFMLGENPEVEITLLHVGASLSNYCTLDFGQEMHQDFEGDIMRSEQRCMNDFYSRAQKVLVEGGLELDQIKTLDIAGKLGVVRTIIDQAHQGDFGTVVLGRRGEQKSFFIGHVADKLVARMPDAAIWVVG
jgi:nucleotide-binding universal stress UspA family protein